MADLQIAVAGDLHDQWDASDQDVLERVKPDALLLVGDLSDGHSRIPSLLRNLDLPLACVLGNHDTGKDASGGRMRRQLELLAERHCGWGLRLLTPPGLAVVGARPGAAGGGFHLSKAVRAVYGPITLRESADRITRAALAADPKLPLLLLAHCGPTGLGSDAADPCGRDWTRPACDWGDQDLALAIEQIRRQRSLPLVVFGHMHHRLRLGRGERRTLVRDRKGTLYFNCASVPRHGQDNQGRDLRHFSWIRLRDGVPVQLAHRWFGLAGELLYEEVVWSEPPGSAAADSGPAGSGAQGSGQSGLGAGQAGTATAGPAVAGAAVAESAVAGAAVAGTAAAEPAAAETAAAETAVAGAAVAGTAWAAATARARGTA